MEPRDFFCERHSRRREPFLDAAAGTHLTFDDTSSRPLFSIARKNERRNYPRCVSCFRCKLRIIGKDYRDRMEIHVSSSLPEPSAWLLRCGSAAINPGDYQIIRRNYPRTRYEDANSDFGRTRSKTKQMEFSWTKLTHKGGL